jgi:hypothetical protein
MNDYNFGVDVLEDMAYVQKVILRMIFQRTEVVGGNF